MHNIFQKSAAMTPLLVFISVSTAFADVIIPPLSDIAPPPPVGDSTFTIVTVAGGCLLAAAVVWAVVLTKSQGTRVKSSEASDKD